MDNNTDLRLAVLIDADNVPVIRSAASPEATGTAT
jgi:hypothetical protein